MKRSTKFNYIASIILSLAIISCGMLCLFFMQGCSKNQQTLEKYKNIDYSFLSNFDYGNSVDTVMEFNSVEELKSSIDEKLSEGVYVTTKGYYNPNDLGGASYIIGSENLAGCIELQNGLYANIVADKCEIGKEEFYVLNVKQFGAKADGVTADQDYINTALAYITNNVNDEKTILYLPEGEYRVDNEILANDIKNAIITGGGEQTVIFTDNGYKSWWEFFFACWRDENCFLANFKIQARECWGQNKYFRQLTLIDCQNCYLFNLTLDVPQTAWTGELFDKVDSKGNVVEPNSFDKQYTNLTIYSGDKNITVDGCTMYQMSGTYRGANIGIMDFYERVTQNVTIKNCILHDNARDEQVGIFSKSNAENSKVIGVNFIGNKVYTHPTPYRDIIGARTMCFTVAYDNEIRDINIEGNEFESYADSKFMTFGSVKNCSVKNNKITVIANHGNGGYVFDSSCASDSDVVISDNDFYLTYASTPLEGKCISAGYLTFEHNRVIADCTVYKIADRLGIYEYNDFQMLGSFGSCGSAVKFNYNTVTSYGEHSNYYNELFFNHSGDSTFNENTVLEFIGNTVTDYTYYDGAKNQKVFDKLCAINNVDIKELRITDNVYNCPNYRYTSAEDYMWICWVRSQANIKNFICKNNDLQGANIVYGAEGGANILREFNAEVVQPSVTQVKILLNGEEEVEEEVKTDKDIVTLTTDIENVNWFVFGEGATVENGVVSSKNKGTYTVFAAATDGSGVYSSVTVQFENSQKDVNVAVIVVPIVCVILIVIIAVVLICIKRKKAGKITT